MISLDGVRLVDNQAANGGADSQNANQEESMDVGLSLQPTATELEPALSSSKILTETTPSKTQEPAAGQATVTETKAAEATAPAAEAPQAAPTASTANAETAPAIPPVAEPATAAQEQEEVIKPAAAPANDPAPAASIPAAPGPAGNAAPKETKPAAAEPVVATPQAAPTQEPAAGEKSQAAPANQAPAPAVVPASNPVADAKPKSASAITADPDTTDSAQKPAMTQSPVSMSLPAPVVVADSDAPAGPVVANPVLPALEPVTKPVSSGSTSNGTSSGSLVNIATTAALNPVTQITQQLTQATTENSAEKTSILGRATETARIESGGKVDFRVITNLWSQVAIANTVAADTQDPTGQMNKLSSLLSASHSALSSMWANFPNRVPDEFWTFWSQIRTLQKHILAAMSDADKQARQASTPPDGLTLKTLNQVSNPEARAKALPRALALESQNRREELQVEKNQIKNATQRNASSVLEQSGGSASADQVPIAFIAENINRQAGQMVGMRTGGAVNAELSLLNSLAGLGNQAASLNSYLLSGMPGQSNVSGNASGASLSGVGAKGEHSQNNGQTFTF